MPSKWFIPSIVIQRAAKNLSQLDLKQRFLSTLPMNSCQLRLESGFPRWSALSPTRCLIVPSGSALRTSRSTRATARKGSLVASTQSASRFARGLGMTGEGRVSQSRPWCVQPFKFYSNSAACHAYQDRPRWLRMDSPHCVWRRRLVRQRRTSLSNCLPRRHP